MLRRLLGIALIVLGLAAAGLGVASATIWRESDSVVATATPQGDGTLVVTDPGVLELVGADVTVAATVPGDGTVTLAIGRDVDVDGWVGIDHYTRVTGLSDWTTLATSSVTPEAPEPEEGQEPEALTPGADPAGSDMWVVQATGEGSATLRWDDRPGRWSLLAAGVGEDATAPTIELTWPRVVTAPWLWPGVAGGGVLVLGGLALLLLGRRGRPAAEGPDAPSGGSGDAEVRPLAPGRGDAWRATTAASTAVGPDVAAAPPGAAPAPKSDATPAGAGDTGRAGSDAAKSGQDPERADKPAALSRRSRRRATAAAAAAAGAGESSQAAPTAPRADQSTQPESAPAAPDAAAAQTPGDGAAPVTGSMPRLTRRELREREEARKAAEQTGITGRLRALTGAIPTVRAASPAPAEPKPDAPPTRASRSQAWRQAWGFDPDATDQRDESADQDTEGGTR
ncbi:hypothetical protein [Xylanimonas ulmi]|uniref:Uncharacterized protein n=1 Tax=Xylanimonas ulmi TaxID=228973 RepID=A0A4Q7M0P5_9MICO|nr:hypothetical protein [Xylanibacterium ulmi]RZS60132.1 hypothetical protein EV386_0375 [Xylanibacterium ulmi]